MSSFTWLDYSEKDRRQMLEVVDLFKQKDTRDELGVGSVRDAFADMLFPGTSTVMTRARYYLIVPWVYRRLEQKRVSAAEFESKARRAELDLIEVIARSKDRYGNLGRIAGRALKRLPSSIYWQGLGVLGIRTFDGSVSQYHRQIDEFYQRCALHDHRRSDDADHSDPAPSNWHPALCDPDDDFPTETSLALGRHEAEYLAERIQLSEATRNSLLSEFVSRKSPALDVAFVWEHSAVGSLPQNVRRDLQHAQNFSEIIHGGALLYNLILAEQTKRKEDVERFRDEYTNWTELIRHRSTAFAAWERDEFWTTVARINPRVSPRTRDFINRWWDMVLAGKCDDLKRTPEARALIALRERNLKHQLARIGNPEAEHDWSGSSGAGQLDFRWDIARTILADINDGLARN